MAEPVVDAKYAPTLVGIASLSVIRIGSLLAEAIEAIERASGILLVIATFVTPTICLAMFTDVSYLSTHSLHFRYFLSPFSDKRVVRLDGFLLFHGIQMFEVALRAVHPVYALMRKS